MDVDDFLSTLLEELNKVGIKVDDLKIDHIAYSASSSDGYEKLLPEFLEKGELIKEAIIGNRRVAIIKYSKPHKWRGQKIEAVELIEPKAGEKTRSGWEHAEFLVDDYDKFISKYPNLNWNLENKDRQNFSRIKLALDNGMEVKFLNTPVLLSARIKD